jgi:hypothetical protein
MIAHILESQAAARGVKPYHLGEFGFISTEAIRAVLNTIIDNNLAGGLLWSLRRHHRDGGFFWHHEPFGGDFFKAYHWPGFASGERYDEANLMRLIRQKAFEIRGLPVPELTPPGPPLLLPIVKASAISWRGSAGASAYDVERAETVNGPWTRVGIDISDARVQYRPLFNDRSAVVGKGYYYRVRAKNCAGISPPSNIVGPVDIEHITLADELWNDAKIFHHKGDITFVSDQARKFKEDCHRLSAQPGSTIIYHVPQRIHSWTMYAFAPDESEHFNFAVSQDGHVYSEITPKVTIFSSGKGNYGYWLPIRYLAEEILAESAVYLKIEFRSEAQISRVEIDYGHQHEK